MADNDEFVERTIGDWTAYQQDDGQVYYHNSKTDESTWDAPPGFEDDAAVKGQEDEKVEEDAVAVDEDGGEFGAQTPPMDESRCTPLR